MKIDGKEVTPENWKDLVKPDKRDLAGLIMVLGRIKEERKLLDKVEKFTIECVGAKRQEEYDEDFGEYHAKRTLEAGRLTPDKEKIIPDVEGLLAEAGIQKSGEDWWLEHQKKGEDFWKLVITKAE